MTTALVRPGILATACQSRDILFATLSISVRDTGIGLKPETIGRLFQPFSQADASTTQRYGGSGLGLAICKRLVELMDSEIGVTSTSGASFTTG